jgi:hypothetical protein
MQIDEEAKKVPKLTRHCVKKGHQDTPQKMKKDLSTLPELQHNIEWRTRTRCTVLWPPCGNHNKKSNASTPSS